jgi:hypothetical protein
VRCTYLKGVAPNLASSSDGGHGRLLDDFHLPDPFIGGGAMRTAGIKGRWRLSPGILD